MESNPAENSTRDSGSLMSVDSELPVVRQMVNLSVVRQIGVMFGLALSVAIGVAVVLWSQTPDYSLLYASVADNDAAEVLGALEKLGIDYKVESSSGAIMVTQDKVHEARLSLAGQGLPKSNSLGFAILQQDSGFGTSRSVESARLQRALEQEIALSITTIQSVKLARVHLALPKQSVFVRQRKYPTASIIVNLYAGRHLEKGQIEAIVHMVASSVPQLEPEHVTVVDQRGTLLNSRDSSNEMYLTSKQFDYKKQIENHLMQRVMNILSPMVGVDGLRAQVAADVDFTVTERTEERFNPDLPALPSEQVLDENSRLSGTQGVPGALSNQPPAAGTVPEETSGSTEQSSKASPVNSSKSATRNYELDKTISHTRMATGVLRRLTVAVVIDDRYSLQEDGTAVSKPYSQEDINRFTQLVKQSVGFDISRGDSVTVTNSAFRPPEVVEALPELPIWQESWFKSLLKQLAAAVAVLIIILGVIRPFMRGLVAREQIKPGVGNQEDARQLSASGGGLAGEEQLAEDRLSLAGEEDPLLLAAPQSYEKRLEFAQKMVDDDPKRVAQVLKNWVAVDG